MQSVTNIVHLRELLAERFPNVRMGLRGHENFAACWPTGLEALDGLLDGGLPKSAITELVSPQGRAGSASVLATIVRQASSHQQWVALVDGVDSFEPAGFNAAELSRLVWVRCENAAQALKAADFLLRDGNIALVILDLRLNPARQLQKIPSSTWYRFQRCLEPAGSALLVITPRAMVGAAQARVQLQSRFTLAQLAESSLVSQLRFELLRTHGIEPEHLIAQAS